MKATNTQIPDGAVNLTAIQIRNKDQVGRVLLQNLVKAGKLRRRYIGHVFYYNREDCERELKA